MAVHVRVCALGENAHTWGGWKRVCVWGGGIVGRDGGAFDAMHDDMQKVGTVCIVFHVAWLVVGILCLNMLCCHMMYVACCLQTIHNTI